MTTTTKAKGSGGGGTTTNAGTGGHPSGGTNDEKPPKGDNPVSATAGNLSPGGADSFPLPLLILGGLALVLVAAGGIGLLVRRWQARGGA
jgi:hypothetical protein